MFNNIFWWEKREERVSKHPLFCCGTTGIRTRDTRIFSPMLYQLSYGTKLGFFACFSQSGCKGRAFFSFAQTFSIFFCIKALKNVFLLQKTSLF